MIDSKRVKTLRNEFLTARIGMINILNILLLHLAILLWLIFAQSFGVSIFFYIPLSLIFCGIHQRQASEWLHEGLHFNIHPNKAINEFVTLWGLAVFLGTPVDAMRRAHNQHHMVKHFFINDDKDTAFAIVNTRADLVKAFLRDLLGVTAIRNYIKTIGSRVLKDDRRNHAYNSSKFLFIYSPIILTQLVLIILSITYNYFYAYVIFYTALITVYQLLSRLRLYGQHLCITENGKPQIAGSTISRTVKGNILDRIAISSRVMQYHFEHHKFPGLPYRAIESICKSSGNVNQYTESHWPVIMALFRVER